MALPTLTQQQSFQNQINNVIVQTTNLFNAQNPNGIVSNYTRLYNTIFSNPAGTMAEAVTQLATQASPTFNTLSALHTFLTNVGVSGLPALPAYTINTDGTVTLN